jgi:hypothetical protein
MTRATRNYIFNTVKDAVLFSDMPSAAPRQIKIESDFSKDCFFAFFENMLNGFESMAPTLDELSLHPYSMPVSCLTRKIGLARTGALCYFHLLRQCGGDVLYPANF